MRRHFSKKGKQLLLKRVLPIGAALIACTGCAYVVNSAQYNDRFLPGTTINGINVSDKTIEEVEAEIRGQEEDYSIKLRKSNTRYSSGSTARLAGISFPLKRP